MDKNGQAEEISWTLSNAPAEIPPVRLVTMARGRYFIERGFQDAKSTLGLAEYQSRGWRAWHHHAALVMPAMLLQLRERLMHADEHSLLSNAEVVELLRHILSAWAMTPEEVLRQLQLRHKKRQAAIHSARRVHVPFEQPTEPFR